MAFSITLLKSTKRHNSTKLPSGSPKTIPNVVLKEGCSLEEPTFILKISDVRFPNLKDYNYFYFEELGSGSVTYPAKYYRRTGFKSLKNDIYELSGVVDVPGTYQNQIKNSYQYVTRTSKSDQISYFDNDDIISPTNVKGGCKVNRVATGFSFTSNPVISIVTYGSAGVQYDLVKSDVQTLTNDLFDNVQDLWDSIYQKLTNPNQYVKNLILLPNDFGLNYTVGTYIKLGNAPGVNIANAINITDSTRLKTITKEIFVSTVRTDCTYNHTGNDPADYRLYNSQFTKFEMFVPFVGKITVPNEVFSFLKIQVRYTVDVVTGQGECIIEALPTVTEGGAAQPKLVINKSTINMGASIPLCASYDNKASIFKDVFNPLNIASDVLNPRQDINMIGSIDGVGYMDIDYIYFMVTDYESDSIEAYIPVKGRPCNKYLQLSTLNNNYVECLNPSIEINGALDSEINEINSMLSSGIYIE